jgi:cytoplasmic iron level regulating protein YaaA (DUF328/UPF0246 family)
MLILLPPSETKRDGGEGPALDLSSLTFAAGRSVTATRKRLLTATVSLARHPGECSKVLKLSAKQAFEVERNRTVLTSATMPAIDRYTGVLFDGLGAPSLAFASRSFLGRSVLIQSALFGPVGALDLIPAYRLSFDSRLPTLAGKTLSSMWSAAADAIEQRSGEGLVLDLRSEGYAALAPLPARDNVFYVRVVTRSDDGAVRALNHFNKKGKGEFLRALAIDAAVTESIESLDDLMAWASTVGVVLELGAPAVHAIGKSPSKPAELNLVVSGLL